jgi:hypothetical protein
MVSRCSHHKGPGSRPCQFIRNSWCRKYTGTRTSPSPSEFPRQYNSTVVLRSFTNHQRDGKRDRYKTSYKHTRTVTINNFTFSYRFPNLIHSISVSEKTNECTVSYEPLRCVSLSVQLRQHMRHAQNAALVSIRSSFSATFQRHANECHCIL